MGKAQREKGKRGEREAAELLRRLWPGAKRSYQQSRSGSDAPDVEGTPCWVEVKRSRSPRIEAAVKQAVEDASGGHLPVMAMTKRDGDPWLVTMPWADFETLILDERKAT